MGTNDSSSQSQTPFPSSNQPRSPAKKDSDLKPNPHPYAIKTTSTGLLTRSNSTSHNTNSTRHRYVPPSPTRSTKTSLSSADSNGSGNSDSRSPRPLPIPPSFPSSSSSSNGDYHSAEDTFSFTPRRVKRAETLPSYAVAHPTPPRSAPPRSTVTLDDLPSNPKLWTPAELASYLTTALRVSPSRISLENGDGIGIPARVAKDIATFVREAHITGRTFLRLNESDLASLNLNKKWAEALLIASRNLRQNVLKGRIWGDGDTNEEHLGSSNTHLEPGDETILFSTDDTTPNAKRSTLKNSKSPTPSRESRSRNSPRPLPNVPSPVPTPQRSRSQRGKVRGMVETFERSGSFSSETGDEDDMDLERGFSRSGFGKGLGGPNGRGVSISGTPNSADAARNGNGFDESQNQSSPPPLPGGFSRKWIRELRHARAPSGGEVIRDDEDDEDAVFMIPGSRGSSSMKAQRQTQGEQRESPSPTRSSPERRPLPAIPRAKTAPITVVPITTSVVTEFGEVPSKVGKRGEGGEQELTMEELLAAAGDEGLSASWGARAWEEVDLKNGVTVKRIADYQPRPSPSHRKGKISEGGVGVCGEFGLRREEDGGEEEGLATIVGPGSNGRVRGYGSRAGSGKKGKARAKEERGVVTALFDPISSPASQGIRIAKDTEVRGVVGEEPSQRSTVDVAVCQTLEHVKRTVDIGIETDKVPLEIESKVPQVENVQEDAEELLKLTAELLRTRALVETFRTRLGFLEGKIASLEEDEVKYLAEQAALQLSPADVRCERLDAGVQANESQENRPGSPAHAHQGTDARPESTTADVTVQVDSHPAHASVRTHAGVQAEDPSELESSQADEDFQDAVDSEDPPLVDFDSVSPVLANGLATPTNSNSKFPEIGSASVVSQATSYLPTFLQNLSSTPLPPDSTLSPPELTAEEKEKSLSLEDRKKDDPEPSTMSELSHYVLMVGIGVCVVALRVMLKRAGGRGGRV